MRKKNTQAAKGQIPPCEVIMSKGRSTLLNAAVHDAMHELRSPLNVIKPYIGFLKRIDNKEKQEAILKRMETAVEKMELIINGFVAYSDLIVENAPTVEYLELRKIYYRIIKELSCQFSNISSNLKIKNSLENCAFPYPLRYLELILKILLEQAFMNRANEEVFEVELNISMIQNELVLKLIDNGEGFSNKCSFQEHYMSFANNSNLYQGKGLGLLTLKYLIESNNGALECLKSKNKSTIIIRLKPYKVFKKRVDEFPEGMAKR